MLLTVEDQSPNVIFITRTSLFSLVALSITLVIWLPKMARVWTGDSQVSMEKAMSGLRKISKPKLAANTSFTLSKFSDSHENNGDSVSI